MNQRPGLRSLLLLALAAVTGASCVAPALAVGSGRVVEPFVPSPNYIGPEHHWRDGLRLPDHERCVYSRGWNLLLFPVNVLSLATLTVVPGGVALECRPEPAPSILHLDALLWLPHGGAVWAEDLGYSPDTVLLDARPGAAACAGLRTQGVPSLLGRLRVKNSLDGPDVRVLGGDEEALEALGLAVGDRLVAVNDEAVGAAGSNWRGADLDEAGGLSLDIIRGGTPLRIRLSCPKLDEAHGSPGASEADLPTPTTDPASE